MAYLPAPSPRAARDMRVGRAMGADEFVRGPHADLLKQINRFTSKGQYGTEVFDLASGTLPTAAIYAAAYIYQDRLVASQAKIPDAGTKQLLAEVVDAVRLGKTAWFVTANEAKVTAGIRGFADAKGLPGWPPGADSFFTKQSILPIAAAVVLAGVILWRKR